jgi:mRNA interferase RelE/StbE
LNVLYRKKFLKELAALPSKYRIKIEHFVFTELVSVSSSSACAKMEKMKGYNDFYKVRFGNYRLGLKFENNKLICERVLHRRDIYKYFP